MALALLLAALSLGRALHRPSCGEALTILLDGDLGAEERARLLAVLMEDGSGAEDRHRLRTAAMAAVFLEDEDGYRALAQRLGGPLLVGVGEVPPEVLRREGLEEPPLVQLLEGMAADAAGDRSAAATSYGRAEASATLWKMRFAARLAREGRSRVGG